MSLDNTLRVGCDVRTITKLGSADKAIIVSHLAFWINKNFTDNNRSVHKDDRWWTYQTYEQIHNYIPCFSRSKIQKIIQKLEKDGVIASYQAKDNHGRNVTKWYTIVDEDIIDWENMLLDRKSVHDKSGVVSCPPGESVVHWGGQLSPSLKDGKQKDNKRVKDSPPLPPPSEDSVREEESVSVTWRDYPSVYDYLIADQSRKLDASDFVSIWNERSPTMDKHLRPTKRTLGKLREFSRDTELPPTALCETLSVYYELLADKKFPAKEEIYKLDIWLDDYDHVAELVRKYRLSLSKNRRDRMRLAWGNLPVIFDRAEALRYKNSIPDFYEGDSMCFYSDPGMLPFPFFYLLLDERITDLSEVHDKFVAIEDYPEFEFLEEYIDKSHPNLIPRFHAIRAEAKRRNNE